MRLARIAVVLFAILAAACSRGSAPALVPVGAEPRSSDRWAGQNGYKRLFTFGGAKGAGPVSALVDVHGMLYGTTSGGGNYSVGGGTAYSFTTSGTEKVLHDFGPPADGRQPWSELVALSGVFYGTTEDGGKYDHGIVYSLTTAGEEHVMHSFGRAPDGSEPVTGLTVVNGNLYGTTTLGGRHNGGTVFQITPSNKERVVYNFGSTEADGRDPQGTLVLVKGILYGTTFQGARCGTVYSLTPGGKEQTLYSFTCDYGDGDGPSGGLVAVSGTLYGVTSSGGGPHESQDAGTVYSVTTTGKEHVLHSFGKGSDGAEPTGTLVLFKGKLYGVTGGGGRYSHGTLFSITTSGTETVVHSFGATNDGSNPYAGVVAVKTSLYGTTANGGTGYHPAGTIYAFAP
ncbi:MAG TPA: choice-of-anchor tandem repeat GloVer-containing protein [Candidatus Tumulicola sp.]